MLNLVDQFTIFRGADEKIDHYPELAEKALSICLVIY